MRYQNWSVRTVMDKREYIDLFAVVDPEKPKIKVMPADASTYEFPEVLSAFRGSVTGSR